MPRFARLRAAEVGDVRPGLARMTLSDGSEAYALTELCGPIRVGDELLVNTSAVDLGLGTGGAHVVHTNLTSPFAGRPELRGRVMKARYLGEQLPVEAFEEAGGSPAAISPTSGDTAFDGAEADPAEISDPGTWVPSPPSLRGVRVVFSVLHSHALALAATARAAVGEAPGYVMTDGGALPFVLSDLAAACLERGVIVTAVSTGQAFGAPIEAVTVASGVTALVEQGIDRIVVSPGLGHIGTASPLGFSALDLVGHAAVLDALGAATALAARASSVDERARHRGVSHHTRAMAALAPVRTVVPTPTAPTADEAAGDAVWIEALGQQAVGMTPLPVADALARSGLSVTTMGRSLADDRYACSWLGAAAAWLAAAA